MGYLVKSRRFLFQNSLHMILIDIHQLKLKLHQIYNIRNIFDCCELIGQFRFFRDLCLLGERRRRMREEGRKSILGRANGMGEERGGNGRGGVRRKGGEGREDRGGRGKGRAEEGKRIVTI